MDYNLSAQEDANQDLDQVLKLMVEEHVVEESAIESVMIIGSWTTGLSGVNAVARRS